MVNATREHIKRSIPQILQLSAQGQTSQNISKATGISKSKVNQILIAHGHRKQFRTQAMIVNRLKKQIIDYKLQGRTLQEIQDILPVHLDLKTIDQVLLKAGIRSNIPKKVGFATAKRVIWLHTHHGKTADQIREEIMLPLKKIQEILNYHAIQKYKIEQQRQIQLFNQANIDKNLLSRLYKLPVAQIEQVKPLV